MDNLCGLVVSDQGTFGDYNSYLEIAFAINVIFVGWLTKVRRRFLRLRRAAKKRQGRRLGVLTAQGVDATTLRKEVDAINARRTRRDAVVHMMENLTKTLCFLMAVAIVFGLLLFGDQHKAWWVNWNWMLHAIGVPISMVGVMAVCETFWSWRIDAHVNKTHDDALEKVGEGRGKATELASNTE